MAMQVVFLAYANSQSNPLPSLAKEDKEVFASLVNETLKGNFIIHRESSATGEEINLFLGKYNNRIAVFHYSGHAGKEYVLLGGKQIFAAGIPQQLQKSIDSGSLKLVVLNGCSTAGQVKVLLELGVPAVIATSAPVNDDTATAFGIKFYQNLAESGMTIMDAFQDALGAAQNTTDRDLDIRNKTARGIDFLFDNDAEAPLWEIFCRDASALDINPLPVQLARGASNYNVNKELRDTLYKVLSKADEIKGLQQKEAEGKFVETADKQDAILKEMPFPIGIQLKKLFMPVAGANEGYDKISVRRIKQLCRVFHTSMEFLGYIMLSQLWEEKLQREENYENIQKLQSETNLPMVEITDDRIQLPPDLLQLLRRHFFATPEERQTFDYITLIGAIRQFFDSLNNDKGITYFIKELDRLKDLFTQDVPGDPEKTPTAFETACYHFTNLQKQVDDGLIGEKAVSEICELAEEKMCHFFLEMGFLHKYNLTSVQNIFISKFRHKRKAEFNHTVVKLMRAAGGSDKILYRWGSFIDFPGIVLVKGDVNLTNKDTNQFEANDNFQFLNLSPFLLDSDAFDKESSTATPMIYAQYIPVDKRYRCTKVDTSHIARDTVEFGENSIYKAVWLDLEYYRKSILMDPN